MKARTDPVRIIISPVVFRIVGMSLAECNPELQRAVARAMIFESGLKNGGIDEGAPGFRDDYGESFYVAYLRNPSGNKIALFCTNSNEPKRGGA